MKNAMQLKAIMKKLAKENQISAQLVLQNYMLERFLERVSLSPYRDNYIIKGGFLISSICVDAMGNLLKPDYLSNSFQIILQNYHLRRIRFHDLRHPYVKPKTKKFITFFEVFGQLHSCP